MTVAADRKRAEAGGRTVERFTASHSSLRPLVAELLRRGAAVRAAKAAAYGEPGLPSPATSEAVERLQADVETAVRGLEEASAGEPQSAHDVGERINALCEALARLRVSAHRFAPARRSRSGSALRELVAAREAFVRAFRKVEREARARHVRKLPWQLELASHVDPAAPVAELEITGYDLSGTPAAAKPWGERCYLTGTPFNTDSRSRPRLRYRSLDSRDHVLCERAFRWVQRARAAMERCRPVAAAAIVRAALAFPLLFEEYVVAPAHPSFTRLGLLDFPSLAVALNNLLRAWGEQPLFGSRGGDGRWPTLGVADRSAVALDGAASGYTWISYDEARRKALALARALQDLGLRAGDTVGLLLHENRVEFYLLEMAAVFGGSVAVGLLPTFSDHLGSMLEQSGARLLLTDATGAALFGAVAEECPQLETLALVGSAAAGSPGIASRRVLSFAELSRRGEEALAADPGWRSASGIGLDTEPIYDDEPGWQRAADSGIEPDADEAPFTILFTSGSTGTPKGTVISRRRWAEEMCLRAEVWPHVAVSFQPSALAADRSTVWRALYNGGRVGFARSGASLFADVRAVRPTLFDVPPVIWNTIYARYKEALADASLDAAEAARIRQRFRGFLGGRLAMMGAGGAAAEPGVSRAMESIFGIPMFEGYGTTEAGFIAMNGVLFPGLDYRLVDRPELGLTSADRPYPRGELAVRTPRTASGYFADAESSQQAYTEDGYFLTGDLVEIRPGGKVRILGRSKLFFKLAGAEFVSPEPLERIYGASELVEQILITGLSTQNQVAAVVVPARPGLDAETILCELQEIGRRRGVRACEVPAVVVVEPRQPGQGSELPWTPENGLLTQSLKLNRPALERHYRSRLEEAYATALVSDPPAAKQAPADAAKTTDRLRQLVAAVVRRQPAEIDLEGSFVDNGGTSLSGMELLLRLEEVFATKDGTAGVWEREITDVGTLPLRELAAQIDAGAEDAGPEAAAELEPAPRVAPATAGERPASRGGGAASASAPATPNVAETSPEAVAAAAESDARWLPQIDPAAPPAAARAVLVTGATGLLGVHLLRALLEREASGAPIFALVRAADHEAARERLESTFGRYGLPAPQIRGLGGNGRIVAVAGHLDQERFGLDDASWEHLATETGLVYHCAAAVDHFAGYGAMRAANVLGTQRVLQLATEKTLKPLHYVSTLNVAMIVGQLGARRPYEELPPPEEITPEIVRRNLGYAITKLVGERLVRGLAARLGEGWPVSISRPAFISWSSESGCSNPEDWLSRLLDSALEIGAAVGGEEVGVPHWIPETPTSARGLELVPVEWAARAISELGEATRERRLPPPTRADASGVATFHVTTTRDDEEGLVTVARLMDLLRLAHLRATGGSHALRALPLASWLLETEVSGAPFVPFARRLKRSPPALPRSECGRFLAAIEALGPTPAIDESAMLHYVERRLRASGASDA